jgi:hypothetical protein
MGQMGVDVQTLIAKKDAGFLSFQRTRKGVVEELVSYMELNELQQPVGFGYPPANCAAIFSHLFGFRHSERGEES